MNEPGKPTGVEAAALKRALAKAKAGKPLTDLEKRVFKAHQKDYQESLRWEYYRQIPMKDWVKMSGRDHRVLIDQSKRYGIPFAGSSINLPDVVKSLHDFLAKHGRRLRAAPNDDPAEMMAGDDADSPWLERFRRERTLLSRLERKKMEKQLLPREEVRDHLARIASVIRGAGENLQRAFGQDAADMLNEALSDCEKHIDEALGDDPDADLDEFEDEDP